MYILTFHLGTLRNQRVQIFTFHFMTNFRYVLTVAFNKGDSWKEAGTPPILLSFKAKPLETGT